MKVAKQLEERSLFESSNDLIGRLAIYQTERFPFKQYAPLVAAFSASGLALSYMTMGSLVQITFQMFLSAFIVSLCVFAQLRISDEIKDREFDQLHHPDRPVPRGLVSLDELKTVGLITAFIQVIASLLLNKLLLLPLLATWSYLFLMHKEFFAADWLRKHQIIYMLSHMGILFFTDLYITSCHWLVAGAEPSSTLLLFFGTSFKLGMVIEIGRKIKAPVEEIPGSNTYSNSWGPRRAAIVWLLTIFASAVFAVMTAWQVGYGTQAIVIASILFSIVFATGLKFILKQSAKSAKRIETISGIWTLCTYLTVGVAPFLSAMAR